MRDRGYVSDAGHEKAGALKRPNSGLPAGPRAFDEHVYLAETRVHTFPGRLFSGALSGECCPFPGTFKPHRTGAGGSNHITLGVC